eukprot:gene30113-biopygen15967
MIITPKATARLAPSDGTTLIPSDEHGSKATASLAPSDVTTLIPSDEHGAQGNCQMNRTPKETARMATSDVRTPGEPKAWK